MNAFPQLSNMDIDNILAYTDYKPEPVAAVATTIAASQSSVGGSVSTDVILIVLVIILLVLVTMLFMVNKTLKAIAKKMELSLKSLNRFLKFQFGNYL